MKKNKVVNLFGDKNIFQNSGIKYSTLLEKFLTPFAKYFDNDIEFEYQEDIFDFAISAWNFGNMQSIIDSTEFEGIMSLAKDDDNNYSLLRKMIDYKTTNFKEFTNFIVGFEIEEKKGVPNLTVITQPEDMYLESLQKESFEATFNQNELEEDEFEENYINRSAIIIKPLQPFIDWHNSIYPDSKIDESHLNEVNIYLINNSNFIDIESYLKKKFDIYFKMELEGWSTYKKDWPKKRTYKMFKQWFRVDISTAVYDLEKKPVSKSE